MNQPIDTISLTRQPWAHQIAAVNRFADQDNFALWHDMGVGKTTTAILLARYKFNLAGEVLPTLIVTPVATLWNWANEWKMNAPEGVSSSVRVIYGDSKKRVQMLKDPEAKIFILNPEAFGIKSVVDELQKMKFGLCIVDEAHTFKNPKSKRFQTMLTITDKIKFKGMLTGTPILNSYLDIWAQFRYLDKGKTFGPNYYVFQRQYFIDKNAGMPPHVHFPMWVPAPTTAKVFNQKLDAMVSRVSKADCLDLPPLVKLRKAVPMSDEQRTYYNDMLNNLIVEVEDGSCVANIALTKSLRLLQILSGFVPLQTESEFLEFDEIVNEKNILKLEKNPRLEQLDEDLGELCPNHKVIVWSNFSDTYDDIKKIASKYGKVAELTGRTKDRQGEQDLFNNDPECRVILSNPQAGGVGINLIAASYSIWFSRNHSLGQRLQAEARNYRGGSEIHKSITQIDYYAPGSFDEDVLDCLDGKQNIADSILEVLRRQRKIK